MFLNLIKSTLIYPIFIQYNSVPKVQESSSYKLINCSLIYFYKIIKNEINCDPSLIRSKSGIIKRFYKPIYIPLIAIMLFFNYFFKK